MGGPEKDRKQTLSYAIGQNWNRSSGFRVWKGKFHLDSVQQDMGLEGPLEYYDRKSSYISWTNAPFFQECLHTSWTNCQQPQGNSHWWKSLFSAQLIGVCCKTPPGICYPRPAPSAQTHSNGPESEPDQSGLLTTLSPFWVPASRSGRYREVCLFLAPPRAIPALDRNTGLHLHDRSSDKSHIVQSHTRQSITDCTTGISPQQKDGFDDLIFLTSHSRIL